jgi:hypothetical protein
LKSLDEWRFENGMNFNQNAVGPPQAPDFIKAMNRAHMFQSTQRAGKGHGVEGERLTDSGEVFEGTVMKFDAAP